MIVKILSKTATFNAVRYNTNKMDRMKAELMRIKNFGIIGNAYDLTPEEVKNYLKTFSASNPRVKIPQFHATISCKGREYDKEQLADIAEKWIEKIGYKENPYIVVFHCDTENNHVHIVSTRIDKNGKKIDDHFEGLRANKILEAILMEDVRHRKDATIKEVETYCFSTPAQFKLLLEKANFSLQEKDGTLNVYKSGELVRSYSSEELTGMTGSYRKDTRRLTQLKQIILKYRKETDNTLVCVFQKLPGNREGALTAYKSDLTCLLYEKFGLEFVFHFKGNNKPYGYTVIDHRNRAVYKGSELMKLGQLIDPEIKPLRSSKTDETVKLIRNYNIESEDHIRLLSRYYKVPAYKIRIGTRDLDREMKDYYKRMLDYYLKHRPLTDLEQLNIVPVKQSGKWYLLDTGSMNILDAEEVLPGKYTRELEENRIRENEHNRWEQNYLPNLNVFVHDEDDERAHGRERRKKKRNDL